jgi:hypothetical protein
LAAILVRGLVAQCVGTAFNKRKTPLKETKTKEKRWQEWGYNHIIIKIIDITPSTENLLEFNQICFLIAKSMLRAAHPQLFRC